MNSADYEFCRVKCSEMAGGASIQINGRVYSKTGYFDTEIGLDTQFSGEVAFSEHKASKLRCKLLTRKATMGLADGSAMDMDFRWPPVRVMLRLENGDVFSEVLQPACPNGSLGPFDYKLDQAPFAGDLCQREITLCVEEMEKFSPIKGATESVGVDICIGWAGLKKMGLGIDPKTHRIVVAKGRLRAGGYRIKAFRGD